MPDIQVNFQYLLCYGYKRSNFESVALYSQLIKDARTLLGKWSRKVDWIFKTFIIKCTKTDSDKAMLKWTNPHSHQYPFSLSGPFLVKKVYIVEMQFWLWVKIQSIPIHSNMKWVSPLLMTKLKEYMLRSGRFQYAAFRMPNIHNKNMTTYRGRLDLAFNYCLLWLLHKYLEVWLCS